MTYLHIDALFGDNVVDWELIKTHWQDLLRDDLLVEIILPNKPLPLLGTETSAAG